MRSIRAKLIAPFVAGTLALTLLLAWYTYSSARQAVEDAMLLISEAKTNHTASSMTLLFKSMSTTLQNMVVDPHVTDIFMAPEEERHAAIERSADWLETLTQGNEYYRDVLIVDSDGVCLSSSNPGHVGTSYADRDYVEKALQGMFTLGDQSVGRVTKKLSATVSGPIDGGSGVVGALVIINDFPKIVDYDSRVSYDSQTIFTAMLAPDGLFMAHKDRDLMGNEERKFPDLYRELAAVGEKGGAVNYSMDGGAHVGYAKVEPASGWLIVTSGLRREVFESAYEVGLTVLGISLAFLAAISFIVIRFANGILSSLLSLIQYAKRVSEGDLDSELPSTERKDELGVLHNALRRLVQVLQTMIAETQKASKMKGEFLANMSHEIRTPLNAVIGMAHLSLRDGDLPNKQRNYLDKIQLSAKALLGVINDILDLSKVEAGMLTMEQVPFSLRETVENSMNIYRESATSKSLELSLDYPSGLPERFIGDPLRIGQVLNNLLSNAIKFTAAGGISVRCWCWEDALLGDDGLVTVHLGVTDSGIGMSQEAISILFQPFTQADSTITRKFGGTGLGLAISNRLVRLMGGSFTVDSAEGQGTTFSFSMKLVPDLKAVAGASVEEISDTAFELLDLHDKKILVAEDNEINQMIIEELLEPTRVTLTMAANGQEAVDAVKTDDFDLVLMDMQMPIMDGLAATRIIRTFDKAQDLPIIAVTANAMREDRDRGLASGMNDYLTKPIEPADLLRVLRVWLVGDGTTENDVS